MTTCQTIPVPVRVAALVLLAVLAGMHGSAQEYLSPVDLIPDADGKRLFVAEATANRVAIFDVAKEKVTKTIALPKPPSGLALSPDGSRLYVTGSAPAGSVFVIRTSKGNKTEATIDVGHSPIAPAVSPDGATLYVCNRFDGTVSVIDLADNSETAKIPVIREPVAAAISPDGKTLIVANHLPAGPGDGDYNAAAVSVIDTGSNAVSTTIALPNGCTGLRGLCISPDGKYAYLTHLLARYQLPTTQLERGWMNTNALSIIDMAGPALVNTVLLDDVDLGAANPWGVACTSDGKYICVTHAGTHEVSAIDTALLHDKLAKVAAGERVSEVSLTSDDVPNDLSFLVGIRRRIKLAGNGPRGLAVLGTTVYAAEYFTDSIGSVDIDPEVRPRPASIPLGPDKELAVWRRGEMLFSDATMCFQHWQSCASCHPDSRVDGLNWDLLNDGMGNPKNAKSMLLTHQTPPSMITGVRATGEEGVRAGIRHILFAVRPEEDAVAIDEHLKALEPVPSPSLVKGKLSKAAKRGQAVFDQAKCAECHPAPLYTNLEMHDVGTGKRREEGIALDTPALIEVWRTAPYLHDGRSATIADVLTTANPNDRHGVTSDLTKEQLNDLAAFVSSL